MPELPVAWKPQAENVVFGKEVSRIDGVDKATGFAKYSADINTPGTLHGKLLQSPYAHARIKAIDVEAARKVPGVKAVYVFPDRAPRTNEETGEPIYFEIEHEGQPIAAVAAETSGQADDGLRAIKVVYEPLEFFVDEFHLPRAVELGRARPIRAAQQGDLEGAFKAAAHTITGMYGIQTISHMCLEPHGSHCEFTDGDHLTAHLSTQNVSGTPGQFASPLGLDAAKVHVSCDYMGGGFGSKFAADEWDIACAAMARDAQRPVKLMLDRATELNIPGSRPSAFAEITVAADADGKLVAWDSHHWGTSGPQGGTVAPTVMPYVFEPKNRRTRATGIVTNRGPDRAWRAPNHPQACALTQTAIDDLAAAIGVDPYDLFLKNLDLTWSATSRNPADKDIYAAELEIAAKLMDWKAKWHPRGEAGDGPVKTGLGLALHTWGGAAGRGTCTVAIHPDGTVETFSGTQDLGTGTRTALAVILAESFGLPYEKIKVHIGSSKYPMSGPSGGSTTIGGVSGPHRRAALKALGRIYDLVAAKHSVDAGTLTAANEQILSAGKPVCTWAEACSLLGPMKVEFQGEGPANDGLTSAQVGGVQMAEVAVDVETGVTKVVRYVAVQDIGTIVCREQAKSQVLGAMIMTIAYALSEERIMDNATGRFVNADLQHYKLPRIGDIGELIVEFYEPESQYKKGVIGLGEPPVISGGAAISNAVANAVGQRIPVLPLTPKRILDSLRS
ncbi:MAG: xanthine dehydrogenase family protein molybdopterin-binding subunit [Planctomyces sp.]|nr:xanthine dehydrogenase family protein molybdopterin-binding subunit [Planctomyces sp.]